MNAVTIRRDGQMIMAFPISKQSFLLLVLWPALVSAWLTSAAGWAELVGGSKFSELWDGESTSSGFLAFTTKAEANREVVLGTLNRFLKQMGWESGAGAPPAASLSPGYVLGTSEWTACAGDSWSHWGVCEKSCLLSFTFIWRSASRVKGRRLQVPRE